MMGSRYSCSRHRDRRSAAEVLRTLKDGRVDGQVRGLEWPRKCPETKCSENLRFLQSIQILTAMIHLIGYKLGLIIRLL